MNKHPFLTRLCVWSLWSAIIAGCATTQPVTKEMPAMTMAETPMALPPTPVTPPNTVYIDNFTFSPNILTIPVGTTITFTNRDDIPHTVTSTTSPRLLNSPTLDTDQSYTFTFTTPGTYPYFCTIHPHMTAKIIVN